MCPCPWRPAAGGGAAHSHAGMALRPPLSWVQSLCGREEPTPHRGSRVILRDRQEQNSLPACPLAAPIWGRQMGGRHTPSEISGRGVCGAPQRTPRADGRGTAGHSSRGPGGRGWPLPPHHHAGSPRVGTGEPGGHPWGLSSQVCPPRTACSGARPVPPQLLLLCQGPLESRGPAPAPPPGGPRPWTHGAASR